MLGSMKKGNKKLIIAVLVIILACAQLIIIGKYALKGTTSYAAETEGAVTLEFDVQNINKANASVDIVTDEEGNEIQPTNTATYSEDWNLEFTYGTSLPTEITMTTSEQTIFYRSEITTEGEETVENFIVLNDVNATYLATVIDKEQLKTLLVNDTDNGIEGKLQILNADTNEVLHEITETALTDGTYEEDIQILLSYEVQPSRISIILQNINTESLNEETTAFLAIEHAKIANGIIKEYIEEDTISKIESKINFIAGEVNETYTKETYVLRTSKATLEASTQSLFYNHDNELDLTINLHTEKDEYELFNNPSFVILIPNYVETIEGIEDADSDGIVDSGIEIQNDNVGFTITDYTKQEIEALNSTAIGFNLLGEQVEWTESEENNTQIKLKLNLKINSEFTGEIKPITLYYLNTTNTQYESDATTEENITCGQASLAITLDNVIESVLSAENETVELGDIIAYDAVVIVKKDGLGALNVESKIEEGMTIQSITVDDEKIEDYVSSGTAVTFEIETDNKDLNEETKQKEFNIKIELKTDEVLIDDTSTEEVETEKNIENVITIKTTDDIEYTSNTLEISIVKSESDVTQEVEIATTRYNKTVESGTDRSVSGNFYEGKSLYHSNLDSKLYFCRQRYGAMPGGPYYSRETITYDGTTDNQTTTTNYYYSWILTQALTENCHANDAVQKAVWYTDLRRKWL